MILFGIALIIIGALLSIGVLYAFGVIAVVVGAVLWIASVAGRPWGRRYY